MLNPFIASMSTFPTSHNAHSEFSIDEQHGMNSGNIMIEVTPVQLGHIGTPGHDTLGQLDTQSASPVVEIIVLASPAPKHV